MAHTRNISTQAEVSDSTQILELSQAAQQGKVLGFGLCDLNPSGCFDIAKGLSFQLYNSPFIRVQDGIFEWKFLDAPPQAKPNYDTVFFTGCGAIVHKMFCILNSLSREYQLTKIRYVYQIIPPHLEDWVTKKELDQNVSIFANSPYRYRYMTSGFNIHSLLNIGIPRFVAKSSEFNVPLECYGVIRHRVMENFLLCACFKNKCLPSIENYLKAFFDQVASAGKDSENKPIMVFAIGMAPLYRKILVEIAQQYSVVIDFCDQYTAYRLPHQEDFFKLISAMKDKKGIVSFDDMSTQSLLQALSFEVPVMVYSNNRWPEFYCQLLNLVPIQHKDTASVILGFNKNYELLKDREECQKVYEFLHLQLNKAHQKFEDFKEANRQAKQVELAKPQDEMNIALAQAEEKQESYPVINKVASASKLNQALTPSSAKCGFFPVLPQKMKTESVARVDSSNTARSKAGKTY